MRIKYAVICTVLFFLIILFSSRVLASGGFTIITKSTTTQEGKGFVFPSPISSEQKSQEPDSIGECKSNRNLSDFLTDVLAYQTAILALLIPLSFDVVSRISDRYRSEVIIKHFQKEKVFLGLIIVLAGNIFYMLMLRFFSIESWGYNSIALILTIVSMILMAAFFWLIFQYTSGISFIKERLLNEAKQLLK